MKALSKNCENCVGFFSWLHIQVKATSDSPDILMALVLTQASVFHPRFEILEKIDPSKIFLQVLTYMLR